MLCSTSSTAALRGFPLSSVSRPASWSLSRSIKSARWLSSLPGRGEDKLKKKKRKNPPRPLASIVLHCDPGAKAALAAATARSTSALKFWEYFFAIWQQFDSLWAFQRIDLSASATVVIISSVAGSIVANCLIWSSWYPWMIGKPFPCEFVRTNKKHADAKDQWILGHFWALETRFHGELSIISDCVILWCGCYWSWSPAIHWINPLVVDKETGVLHFRANCTHSKNIGFLLAMLMLISWPNPGTRKIRLSGFFPLIGGHLNRKNPWSCILRVSFLCYSYSIVVLFN